MLYLPKEDGQGLVEYALIMIMISVAVIAVLTLLGPQIGDIYSNIKTSLEAAGFGS
ncbi:MAG: Flp family type IVb pilin [Anaerolineae bacterium]|nr:Flp family type IVb pilin [Anaerolineae bacterium]